MLLTFVKANPNRYAGAPAAELHLLPYFVRMSREVVALFPARKNKYFAPHYLPRATSCIMRQQLNRRDLPHNDDSGALIKRPQSFNHTSATAHTVDIDSSANHQPRHQQPMNIPTIITNIHILHAIAILMLCSTNYQEQTHCQHYIKMVPILRNDNISKIDAPFAQLACTNSMLQTNPVDDQHGPCSKGEVTDAHQTYSQGAVRGCPWS